MVTSFKISLIQKTKVSILCYSIAVSHKDWEIPNSRIQLALIDFDHGLDFPSRLASRPVTFCSEKLQTKIQQY